MANIEFNRFIRCQQTSELELVPRTGMLTFFCHVAT